MPALPKTRSGKILRKTMRGIAHGKDEPVPSTIEDPTVLETLKPILQGAMTVTIDEIHIGDPASVWRDAGFSVDDDSVCRIGDVRVRLGMGGTGIVGWTLRGGAASQASWTAFRRCRPMLRSLRPPRIRTG